MVISLATSRTVVSISSALFAYVVVAVELSLIQLINISEEFCMAAAVLLRESEQLDRVLTISCIVSYSESNEVAILPISLVLPIHGVNLSCLFRLSLLRLTIASLTYFNGFMLMYTIINANILITRTKNAHIMARISMFLFAIAYILLSLSYETTAHPCSSIA